MTDLNRLNELLKGYGAAHYLHKAMRKTAERARDALGYLVRMGVFDKRAKRTAR